MGATQSQEEPDVVRINRSEVPDEYKTVGVSSDVVRRVNSQSQGDRSNDASKLREELARERQEKMRMREEMARLSELQQRTLNARQIPLDSSDSSSDFEERKRIFDETVERVQSKFFAYHRENVCSNNEKEIMSCLKANPGRILKCAPLADVYEKCITYGSNMRWLYTFFIVLTIILIYFRLLPFRHRRNNGVTKWIITKSSATYDSLRYRNCSLSTCLRSHPCMLDYGSISVYIQPLLEVEYEDGTVLTPVPSREFYSIRSSLEKYSVPDPKEACLVFPGVDFLNLNRFPSIEAAHLVANTISERFSNVLIFTLIGQWKHSFRLILASPVTPRRIYRPRLDISLPPFFGASSSISVQRSLVEHKFVVPLFNVSLSFREESIRVFSDKEDVTILTECFHQRSLVCNLNGDMLDWKHTFQKARFGLIHESMPHFELALYRALESSVIPVIIAPNYVLPFADYVDWHSIALFPSNLSHILDVLNSLDSSKVEIMQVQIQHIFTRFSSLHGIVNMTMRVLESRLLPTKSRSLKQWTGLLEKPFTLPHFESATQLSLLIESDKSRQSQTLQIIRKLVSSRLMSSITVIWRDLQSMPSIDDWKSVIPVEIITGISQIRGLRYVISRSKTDVLLVMPLDLCSLDNKILRKALNVCLQLILSGLCLPCT
ncbi:hypothetical protein KIN20_035403 [Parelaphostrongylus tenuis]|uniref:Exostosin GT47 domain-containing protein n=1 Tax=Parelaphostrongylus tenuis TaxID=148309 RepID=A0AAD5WJX2_PARTN|nr:hypothetical protein KIN20_035403 [Parelaphostrongylus tenuis]